MILVHTIISGAQTGADRGALLAARDLGLKRGGMAPAGWRSEDGEIPPEFRVGMMQSPSPAYPVRTRANVEASGGTLILSIGPLRFDSGSMLTAQIARTVGKPVLHVMIDASSVSRARIRDWLREHQIRTLNVAGPRETREPGLQQAARVELGFILYPIVRAPDDAGFGG